MSGTWSIPAGQAGAFTLASAKNHSSASLTYEFPGESEEELEEERQSFGATAAGRSAISADGRTVAFVTTAQSDLAGPGTPPLQVAVRHLDSEETQLVSVRFDPSTGHPAREPRNRRTRTRPGGERKRACTGRPTARAFQPTVRAPAELAHRDLPGAETRRRLDQRRRQHRRLARSADRRTGAHAQRRKTSAASAEPLWRRIADGPQKPDPPRHRRLGPRKRRLHAHPESQLPPSPSAGDPCQGPFATQLTGELGTWNARAIGRHYPAAERGRTDSSPSSPARRSSARRAPSGSGPPNTTTTPTGSTCSEPTKASALRPLTQFASGDENRISTNAQIEDIAISPDGQQVAFTTARTVFSARLARLRQRPRGRPGAAGTLRRRSLATRH